MKILSIDGGGIRGIYAAHILKRISDELEIDYSDYFDLIIGTSTGSIIAAALATNYPISDVVKLYKEKGEKIFSANLFSLFGLVKPKYKSDTLQSELFAAFGEKTLSQTQTRLVIPATNVGNGQVFVFKSNYLNEFVRDKDIKIREAVLASCSAPLFFKPHVVKEYMLADGGLWANNPSLVGVIEATGKLNGSIKNVKMLSIGTGIGSCYYRLKKANCRWGFIVDWKHKKLVDMILNLQSKSVQNMVGLLLDESQYLRINFEQDKALSLDDIESVPDLISKADHDFTYNFNKLKTLLSE